MNFSIRNAAKEDMGDVLALINELAEFAEFRISTQDMWQTELKLISDEHKVIVTSAGEDRQWETMDDLRWSTDDEFAIARDKSANNEQ